MGSFYDKWNEVKMLIKQAKNSFMAQLQQRVWRKSNKSGKYFSNKPQVIKHMIHGRLPVLWRFFNKS
jgi:hypothetical protein